MSRWAAERGLVLETARKMVEKGLVIGKAGNVSVRLASTGRRSLLAITPTSRYYDSLTPDDIPVIDFQGKPVEGATPPSSEAALHIGVYQARPDVNAVIHTHSPYATVLAVSGLEIPPVVEDQMVFLGGEVKIARYAPSGTDEMAANAIEALGERNAVLLAAHGAIGVGRSLREALTVCELLEKTAMVYVYAMTLGKANPLSAAAVTTAQEAFARLQQSPDL